jgi:hypothetical protein
MRIVVLAVIVVRGVIRRGLERRNDPVSSADHLSCRRPQ